VSGLDHEEPPTRIHCDCACHTTGAMHMTACCQPDPPTVAGPRVVTFAPIAAKSLDRILANLADLRDWLAQNDLDRSALTVAGALHVLAKVSGGDCTISADSDPEEGSPS